MDTSVRQTEDRVGALEWLALLAVLTHGTQAAFNVLCGPKGAATMYISLADLLLAAAFVLWLFRRLSRRDFSRPPVTLPLLAAGWMALSLVAMLWRLKADGRPCGGPAKSGVKEVLQFFGYFVAGWIIFTEAFRSERVRRWAVFALAFAALAAVATGLVSYFRNAPAREVAGWGFQDRHTFGIFLALALPPLFGVALFACAWWKRAIVAVLLLVALCAVLAGGPFLALCVGLLIVAALRGRTALLITAAVLLLFCTQMLPRLPRRNSAVLLDSVALYRTNDPYGLFNEVIPDAEQRLDAKQKALAGKIASGQPVESFGEIPDESDYAWRWSQRWQEWQAALNMISERPWLGVGPGAYQANVGPHYGDMPKYAKNLMEPDALSFYMVWGATLGLPFLLIFGCMALDAFRRAGRAFVSAATPFDKGLAAGLIGSLSAFLVGGIFTDPLVRGVGITAALPFALAAALVTIQPSRDKP